MESGLIAQSRIDIDAARLLVYKTAWLIDRYGARGAKTEISAIKVLAPQMATTVIDRAIEVFGAAGVSDDTPLAYFYAWGRVPRIVDARRDLMTRKANPVILGGVVCGTWARKGNELTVTWLDCPWPWKLSGVKSTA